MLDYVSGYWSLVIGITWQNAVDEMCNSIPDNSKPDDQIRTCVRMAGGRGIRRLAGPVRVRVCGSLVPRRCDSYSPCLETALADAMLLPYLPLTTVSLPAIPSKTWISGRVPARLIRSVYVWTAVCFWFSSSWHGDRLAAISTTRPVGRDTDMRGSARGRLAHRPLGACHRRVELAGIHSSGGPRACRSRP